MQLALRSFMRTAHYSRVFLIMIATGCSPGEPSVATVDQPVSCLTANTGQTQYSAIPAQNGVFEAVWTVTPGTAADAGVGFSPLTDPSTPQPGWNNMSTITRFLNGVID